MPALQTKNHEWYNARWFKRMAVIYDLIEPFAKKIRTDVANIALPKGSKILDMACGTGSQSIAFAQNGHEVVGVDLSPHMLKQAKKKIKPGWKIKFLNLDASHIPYKDSHFDLAVISFGLHDMPEEIGVAVLLEMKRATKPNGKLIIVDYNTPESRVLFTVAHNICKTWESKYYDHFLSVKLEHYLNRVDLVASNKKTYLMGNVQAITCSNNKHQIKKIKN